MRKIVATAFLGLLAACGSNEDDTTTFKTADGETVTIAERKGESASWPEGFSPYPDAQVVSDMSMGTDDATGQIITFESADGPDDIADFYREQAETAGFKINMDFKVDGDRLLTAEAPDGRTFSMNTETAADVTEVSLSISGGG